MQGKGITYSAVTFITLAKNAFKELGKNDPLRMAGATAFFTTFALPPILIILIQILGLVFNPKRITAQLVIKLSDIIGKESVQQVVNTLMGFRKMAQNPLITIGGFIFLMFVATTLFKVIKSSLNQVWKIKAIRKHTLYAALNTRWRSFFVILVAGILFVIGLLAEAMQAYLGKYLYEFSPLLANYFNSALNYILSFIMVTAWFGILFRYLPDARAKWKIAFLGGFVTSILFNLGKVILHWLLTYNNFTSVYGASASIVLLLLFVFYSSLILYYGAAFTKVWAAYIGKPITPLPYAVHYHLADDDENEVKVEQ
ncbi:MAG TPA: YihY/virulence factor BrkB family protein [Chitinophagaceae bacterium]|nr:YihY/virulence factor BrkB family protein [Chitinophagaceae bacterium]